MNKDIRDLKILIEEYDDLGNELENMRDDWDDGDECDQAENDPGLQFEKEMEIEAKLNKIKSFWSDND